MSKTSLPGFDLPRRRRWRVWALVLCGLAARTVAGEALAVTNAVQVVDVLVTTQTCDERMPWRLSRPMTRQGYGVVVGPGRVLTTEELIRQATLVELRQPGRAMKVAATLRQSDPQCNVALLETTDAAFCRELAPVPLAGQVARGDQTRIVQYDDSGLRQEGTGRIIEIGVEALPSAPAAVLTCRVLSDLRVLNPGAPVFSDGYLAGMMMRYDAQHQTGFVLPAPVLSRFLLMAAEPEYQAPPSEGFSWVPLVDAVKRRYLGVPAEVGGVLIIEVATNGSVATALQPNDVLVAWDGFALDNQGFYPDPQYGRTRLVHAIAGRHRVNDRVTLEFIRRGVRQKSAVVLQPYQEEDTLVPENTRGTPPAYLVESGLVLRELTARYLRAGGRGLGGANLRLAHLYLAGGSRPAPAGEHLVILSGVLPDPANVGYQELRDELVTAVNGEPVHNLAEVCRILDRDGSLTRLRLEGRGVELALDATQRASVNARIARAYRIPELRRCAGAR
jgi:hypothetical protein